MPTTARERAMRLIYLTWLNVPSLRSVCDRLMRWVFGCWAADWDDHVSARGVDRFAALHAALDGLEIEPSRVIDLGCGTGTTTINLSERYRDAWVIGIDSSFEMLELARGKASESGSSAQFKLAYLQDTGLGAGSADLVVLLNAPPAFEEVAWILASGGHVVVAASRGPQTAFYSSVKRLERGFKRHGLTTVAHGTASPGEFYVAVKR